MDNTEENPKVLGSTNPLSIMDEYGNTTIVSTKDYMNEYPKFESYVAHEDFKVVPFEDMKECGETGEACEVLEKIPSSPYSESNIRIGDFMSDTEQEDISCGALNINFRYSDINNNMSLNFSSKQYRRLREMEQEYYQKVYNYINGQEE